MKRYPSATEGMLYPVLHVTAGGMVVLAGLLWVRDGGSMVAALFNSCVLLSAAALIYWFMFDTWYGLDHRGLSIRSGPYRLFIPYADIRGVAPTTSMLASPALSLRRLYIDHAGSPLGVRISPVEPDRFVADLAQHCPHLVHDGYHLKPG